MHVKFHHTLSSQGRFCGEWKTCELYFGYPWHFLDMAELQEAVKLLLPPIFKKSNRSCFADKRKVPLYLKRILLYL